MKRSVLCIVLVFSMLFLFVNMSGAVPVIQESSDSSEETDVFEAISVFSQIFSAGMEAAGAQLYGGGMYGTETTVEEPTSEPIMIPTEVPTEVPTEIPTEIPTEEPAPLPPFSPEPVTERPVTTEPENPEPVYEPEAQVFAPPADPDQYSVSFGIPVDDFYSNFKSMVKEHGRHSVSFEEKGRKSASKIVVDDDNNIYLYYSKEKGKNIIDRISFETKFSDNKQMQKAENVFTILLETLCGSYYDIAYDEQQGSDLFALSMNNGAAFLDDLMLYGDTEQKGGNTELTVKIYYSGSEFQAEAVSGYSQSAENEFRDLVADLKQSGIIPDTNGDFRYHEDYENEWAYINWYQWESFDQAQNFVITADIEWHSASNTPNFSDSGCGFVLRAEDTNNNLYTAMNMDGKVHFGGISNGSWLGYKSFGYGEHSTKGTGQLTVVADGDTLTAYVNGIQVGQQKVVITKSGKLAFSVWSGTNKGYGTRCSFKNVYYYVW